MGPRQFRRGNVLQRGDDAADDGPSMGPCLHKLRRYAARGMSPGMELRAKFGTTPPAGAGGGVSGVEIGFAGGYFGGEMLLQWSHALTGMLSVQLYSGKRRTKSFNGAAL